jgi:hypothetical protein
VSGQVLSAREESDHWFTGSFPYERSCSEFYDEGDGGEEFGEWTNDPVLEPAKADALSWFKQHPTEVFYGRQIEVILEKRYFHWVTHKPLRELTNEGAISSEVRKTQNGNPIRFYWWRGNRYPKRAVAKLLKEVEEHSRPDITRAIGGHAESVFGFAASRAGFNVIGPNVKSYRGKEWTISEHDFDWIFERDGIGWAVEIKNSWAYIDKTEMETKVWIAQYLGIRPLFIMRWAPKHYIQIIRRDGFALLYQDQYFPFGHTEAVERLKGLGLPVLATREVQPGVFERFVRWHEQLVKK